MPPAWLRQTVRALNRSRPWWWRGLNRVLPLAPWGWQIEPGNEVHLQGVTAPGLEVTLRGQGHRVRVEPGAILRNVVFDIAGQGHDLHIAAGCVLNQVYIRLRGQGHRLALAPGIRFTRGGEIWMEDRAGRLTIGENTTIVHARLSVMEGTHLRIGAGSLFAYDIEVRTGDSHSILDAATGQRLNPAADVDIGERVWVGARAMILKGARVPADSVVAAAAVVTRAFDQPGIVLAGHPARVLRTGIRWTTERV
ncbi:MAG: hypothetical protein GXO37_03850, partial [Chloroflexi bacterium]|nr:hypothetical protein [Chloroflexota bacterium]